MRWRIIPSTVLLILTGCGSEYGYRYRPHPQQWGNSVYADYRLNGNIVDILVDTNGFRLQTITVTNPDGTFAKPTSIDYPPFADEIMSSGGALIHGSSFARGPTVAHFTKSDVGPLPWEVHLNIQSMKPTVVHVGG